MIHIKFRKQDKGHAAEVRAFLHAVKEGSTPPITVEEIMHSMRTTLMADISLREGRVVKV